MGEQTNARPPSDPWAVAVTVRAVPGPGACRDSGVGQGKGSGVRAPETPQLPHPPLGSSGGMSPIRETVPHFLLGTTAPCRTQWPSKCLQPPRSLCPPLPRPLPQL